MEPSPTPPPYEARTDFRLVDRRGNGQTHRLPESRRAVCRESARLPAHGHSKHFYRRRLSVVVVHDHGEHVFDMAD